MRGFCLYLLETLIEWKLSYLTKYLVSTYSLYLLETLIEWKPLLTQVLTLLTQVCLYLLETLIEWKLSYQRRPRTRIYLMSLFIGDPN